MRKTLALGLTAVVSAATLAAGASAAAAAECDTRIPEFGDGSGFDTIYFENGELKINPNGVGADLVMLREWTEGRASAALECAFSLVPPEVGCAVGKLVEIIQSIDPLAPDLRYVYYDQSTGTLAVRYQVLLNDATACIPA